MIKNTRKEIKNTPLLVARFEESTRCTPQVVSKRRGSAAVFSFLVVLTRTRDFQGISPNSFDGHGNYSIGIREQSVFQKSGTMFLVSQGEWMFALQQQLNLTKNGRS